MNTSLAVKGTNAHTVQCCTACKIPNAHSCVKSGTVNSPVRPGVPNNDQFFNDFGLLIILFNCFFPGWFLKKS